jgi:hypothetical protein
MVTVQIQYFLTHWFQASAAMLMRSALFWDITRHHVVTDYHSMLRNIPEERAWHSFPPVAIMGMFIFSWKAYKLCCWSYTASHLMPTDARCYFTVTWYNMISSLLHWTWDLSPTCCMMQSCSGYVKCSSCWLDSQLALMYQFQGILQS